MHWERLIITPLRIFLNFIQVPEVRNTSELEGSWLKLSDEFYKLLRVLSALSQLLTLTSNPQSPNPK